jgi:hypothetical protein
MDKAVVGAAIVFVWAAPLLVLGPNAVVVAAPATVFGAGQALCSWLRPEPYPWPTWVYRLKLEWRARQVSWLRPRQPIED